MEKPKKKGRLTEIILLILVLICVSLIVVELVENILTEVNWEMMQSFHQLVKNI